MLRVLLWKFTGGAQGQKEGQWLGSHRSVCHPEEPTEKAARTRSASKAHVDYQRLGLGEATEFRDKQPLCGAAREM